MTPQDEVELAAWAVFAFVFVGCVIAGLLT